MAEPAGSHVAKGSSYKSDESIWREPASQEVHDKAVEILGNLGDLFAQADDDGSGFLDKIELAALLHKYHRKVDKTARPMKRIQKEVNEAIADYDRGGTGSLDYWEFVSMIIDPKHEGTFQIKADPLVKREMNEITKAAQEYQSELEGTGTI